MAKGVRVKAIREFANLNSNTNLNLYTSIVIDF